MLIHDIISFQDFFNGNRLIISNARDIVQICAKKIGERSPSQYNGLSMAKDFIVQRFKEYGAIPVEELFEVDGRTYSNIIVELEGKKDKPQNEIILLGAHYDTVEGTVGANDNASGIAGLLEIYRILSKKKMMRTVRFVAFTLEEPPYFGTDKMGSMVHASRCVKKKENIKLMISLDMIGCAHRFAKQEFPVEGMKSKYPSTADFLAVVSFPSSSQFAFLWQKLYNSFTNKRIYEVVAPASIEGVSHSDHMSFHKHKFPSLMITDTGMYRSKHYHTANDTEEKINYRFLMKNILHISSTLRHLANLRDLPKNTL